MTTSLIVCLLEKFELCVAKILLNHSLILELSTVDNLLGSNQKAISPSNRNQKQTTQRVMTCQNTLSSGQMFNLFSISLDNYQSHVIDCLSVYQAQIMAQSGAAC